MALAIVLRILGAAAGVWLWWYSYACHVSAQEAGMTGQLVDESEARLPLFSFSFLADEHWGGIAATVPDISALLACIHYDTTAEGSGHVLSLRRHAPDVRMGVLRKGAHRVLRQGEDLLLVNGDVLIITQGDLVHRYRYERKTIYPHRKEEGTWLN